MQVLARLSRSLYNLRLKRARTCIQLEISFKTTVPLVFIYNDRYFDIFSALEMNFIQVSQCFDDGNNTCIPCGSLISSLPSVWISVKCSDDRPSTHLKFSVQPAIGVERAAEKLFICSVEVIGSSYDFLKQKLQNSSSFQSVDKENT